MYKDILIVIINNSNKNILQIFNSNKKMIKEYKNNNRYIFKGKINEAYGIKIITNNKIYNTSLYISKLYNYPYVFNISNNYISHKIFIKVKDQNYNGLQIEKGEIKLWLNHIM